MPTPPRTSLPEIVAAGRSILEADGLGGLTMQRVAEEVGVRSPSLYKRVRSRGDLIRLIADSVADDLAATMDAAASGGDPANDLRASHQSRMLPFDNSACSFKHSRRNLTRFTNALL